MPAVTPLALYRKANLGRLAREIVRGIPAGLVISLNAWAVSAWLKATILINSQPRWLFRKKRWSEGEMRAISCYYLVIAYMMLRVVRLTSTLTKCPGRPYGDFFRNTRPILGQIAIFSIATMLTDEFVMFYILRKFGLEKRRILITGRPLDKEIEVTDDDCCICYGAMLDDDEDGMDLSEHSNNNGRHSHGVGINKDTDHVLENFCVVKQHVAHRGCIRKWYNYGPQGYRPMEAFRILSWGTTIHGAVAGMNTTRAVGNRIGLGWLMSLPTTTATTTTTTTRTGHGFDARVPLVPTIDGVAVTTLPGTPATTITTTNNANDPAEHDQIHAEEPLYSNQQTTGEFHTQTQTQTRTQTQTQTQTQPHPHQPIQQQQLDQQQQQHRHHQHESTHPVDVAEPVLRPMFTTPPTEEYNQSAGRKTCPACRQQLVLNFVDLAKGRKEMGWRQKLVELGRDMTKFSDWRGLVLRSLITAGWVGVTIVGGKLRIVALDKAIVRHQKNRALATLSALALAESS